MRRAYAASSQFGVAQRFLVRVYALLVQPAYPADMLAGPYGVDLGALSVAEPDPGSQLLGPATPMVMDTSPIATPWWRDTYNPSIHTTCAASGFTQPPVQSALVAHIPVVLGGLQHLRGNPFQPITHDDARTRALWQILAARHGAGPTAVLFPCLAKTTPGTLFVELEDGWYVPVDEWTHMNHHKVLPAVLNALVPRTSDSMGASRTSRGSRGKQYPTMGRSSSARPDLAALPPPPPTPGLHDLRSEDATLSPLSTPVHSSTAVDRCDTLDTASPWPATPGHAELPGSIMDHPRMQLMQLLATANRCRQLYLRIQEVKSQTRAMLSKVLALPEAHVAAGTPEAACPAARKHTQCTALAIRQGAYAAMRVDSKRCFAANTRRCEASWRSAVSLMREAALADCSGLWNMRARVELLRVYLSYGVKTLLRVEMRTAPDQPLLPSRLSRTLFGGFSGSRESAYSVGPANDYNSMFDGMSLPDDSSFANMASLLPRGIRLMSSPGAGSTQQTYMVRSVELKSTMITSPNKSDDVAVSTALGFACTALCMLATYQGVQLRYDAFLQGSRTTLLDNTNPSGTVAGPLYTMKNALKAQYRGALAMLASGGLQVLMALGGYMPPKSTEEYPLAALAAAMDLVSEHAHAAGIGDAVLL